MTTTYIFVLGREQDLSRAEIERVFLRLNISHSIVSQQQEYLTIESTEINPAELMDILGGTIKILEHIPDIVADPSQIANYLDKIQPEGKIVYSLSGMSQKQALAVKKELKQQGRSVRYILPKNSATVIHNNLVKKQGDLFVLNKKIFITRAIQDIETLSVRDYNRPGRDSRRGMLPPKLARILVNLLAAKKDAVMLDPFCGSGTILMEALLLGYTQLIGSDILSAAIEDTKKSLQWIIDKEQLPQDADAIQLFVQDATTISQRLSKESVDHIVFEPFMGKGRSGKEQKKQLEKSIQELTTLFDKAFSEFHNILKQNGSIVCIIPRFTFGGNWLTIAAKDIFRKHHFVVEPLADQQHLLYHREDQFVGREIWLLKKQA